MWRKEKDVKKFLKSLNADTAKPACDYFVMSVLIAANSSKEKPSEHEIMRQVANWYGLDVYTISQEIGNYIFFSSLSKLLFDCEKSINSVVEEVANKVISNRI